MCIVEYLGEVGWNEENDEGRTMILYHNEQKKDGRKLRMKFNYTDGHFATKDFSDVEVNAIFHFLNSFEDGDGDFDIDGLMKAREVLLSYY